MIFARGTLKHATKIIENKIWKKKHQKEIPITIKSSYISFRFKQHKRARVNILEMSCFISQFGW